MVHLLLYKAFLIAFFLEILVCIAFSNIRIRSKGFFFCIDCLEIGRLDCQGNISLPVIIIYMNHPSMYLEMDTIAC